MRVSGFGVKAGESVAGSGFFGAGVVGAGIESGDFVVPDVEIGAGGFGGTVTGAAARTLWPMQPPVKTVRLTATIHVKNAVFRDAAAGLFEARFLAG
ncbi:MAG: hypothetical protein WBE21_13725 [Candidatus Acidiferrales bacterium]